MKFILLILLGVCAVIAQSTESEDGINRAVLEKSSLGAIQNIVDGVIELAQNAVADILKNVENVVQTVQNIVNGIVDAAKEQIINIQQEIEKVINEIAKQNDIARNCTEEECPRVKAIIQSVNDGLDYCGSNALQQVQDLQSEVDEIVDNINKQIRNIQNITINCLSQNVHRPISALGCVIGHAGEIRQNITAAVNQASDAISLVVGTIPKISQQVNECSSQVVSSAPPQIQQVLADIHQCIRDKNQED